jgi:hypothetical protein
LSASTSPWRPSASPASSWWAVIAGITAGILFTWYRSRRAITIIEARGGQHDLFKV